MFKYLSDPIGYVLIFACLGAIGWALGSFTDKTHQVSKEKN